MQVVVATHGHCFDGLASAAVFTQMLKEIESKPLAFCYHACGYGIGQKTATPELFTGHHNAVLDYRLTAASRLNWFFDHHRTAFPSSVEQAFFDERKESNRYHYDPTITSCTKLIYRVAREQFGLSKNLEELVHWADMVDSAAFSSPETAIDRSDPIMQLVSVTEAHGTDQFIAEMATLLLSRPLLEVAQMKTIQRRFKPMGVRHDRFVSAVRSKAEPQGRVVFVDLTDRTLDMIGKFVTYALYPQHQYSVVVARLKRGFKISVGYNPWCGQPLDTDISAICARYGGGGHPVVGGIAIADGQRERAQSIAGAIVTELNG